MVVSLGPGKFYGSSLPRPRIYTDVKFNDDRVDPPLPVTDPLLSWAQEAHWSMGGLSFKRLRLQGRIEGNVNKFRKHREKQAKLQPAYSPKEPKILAPNREGKQENNKKRVGSASPPSAPKVVKRRRYVGLIDEESEEEAEEEQEVVVKKAEVVEGGGRKRPARKLVGDFDRVAKEGEVDKNGKGSEVMGLRTRRKGLEGSVGDVVMKVVEEVNREYSEGGKKLKSGKKGKSGGGGAGGGGDTGSSGLSGGIRTSPRLAKQRLS